MDTPGVDPAARNSTGTTTPKPAPIAANPASATTVEPLTSASVSADAPGALPRERDRAETSVEAVAEDPARGHCERKSGVAERSRRGAGSERVGEVDGAPVGGGSSAMRVKNAAAPSTRSDRCGRASIGVGLIVSLGQEEAPTSDERAQLQYDGDRAEVRHWIDAGCGSDRAEPGAGKAAEAEGRVERREDRTLLSRSRKRFLRAGDVDRAEPGPNRKSAAPSAASPPLPCQHERSTSPEQRSERDRPAADPLGQSSGRRHREEGAERHGEQRGPELPAREPVCR